MYAIGAVLALVAVVGAVAYANGYFDRATARGNDSAGVHDAPVRSASPVPNHAPGGAGADVPAGATSAAPAAMTLDAAQAAVQQQGYAGACSAAAPACAGAADVTAAWCDACPLHLIIGVVTPSADGYVQRAFFFTDHYIGTDARTPSATIGFVSRTADTVTLRYPLYQSGDRMCCPSGGAADVRFRWDGQQLTPLDPIPSDAQRDGTGAPPAAAAAPPSAAECAWAVATMRNDAAIDRSAANVYPSYAAYYTTWSGRWAQIAAWIETGCAPTWPHEQCAAASGWIAFAISTHQTTGSTVPHDLDLDAVWLENYARIGSLIEVLCG